MEYFHASHDYFEDSPDWLERVFFSEIEPRLSSNGTIYRLATDSYDESVRFFEEIRNYVNTRGGHCVDFRLNRKDSVLDFSMQFGELQKAFLPETKQAGTVLLLRDGTFYMQTWELDEIVSQVKCFAKWTCTDVVFFLSRQLDEHRPVDYPIQDLASVPSIKHLDESALDCLIKGLMVNSGLSNIDTIDALITYKHHFSSISELKQSVRDFAEKENVSGHAFRNYLEELFALSEHWVPLVSRECLLERWNRSLAILENINKDPVLYRDWERKRNPFACDLPIYWFETLVSVLGNIVTDAGKKGIKVIITHFQFNEKTRHLQGDPATKFYELLHTLRTFHSHGMNPSSDSDRKKIEYVEEWFRNNKADRRPTLFCYRHLANVLLSEWEKAINITEKVVEHVQECETCRNLVKEQITNETLDISGNELSDFLDDFFQNINNDVIEISESSFRALYFNKIKERLKASCVSSDLVYLKLNDIVLEFVHCTFAHFPINGDWLRERGIPRGKPVGLLLQELKEYWKDNLFISSEEMIEYAERRCKDEIETHLQ